MHLVLRYQLENRLDGAAVQPLEVPVLPKLKKLKVNHVLNLLKEKR
jgi:hypothetical protein